MDMSVDNLTSRRFAPGKIKTWIGAALSLPLLSVGLAWIASGFQSIAGWSSFLGVLLLATGILIGGQWALREEKLPRGLIALLVGAALLRLAVGVFWSLALPIWGHGTPAEKAGYVMADAFARDQAAWKLARSDQPLWTAFQNQRTVDQYGGLLFLSALIYRSMSGDFHQPLLIVVITAAFSALGVLFIWALVRNAWGEAAAWLAAWVLALYPEAILLGSSQMREAFMIPLTVMAFYGLSHYQRHRSWASLSWILIPILLYLPFSPPFAALLVVTLALAALMTIGRLTRRDILQQRRLLLIFGMLLVLVLIGLWLALRQFTPEGMSNPLAMLSWWLRKSAKLQYYLTEHASGWMQKIFASTPEWMHLPLLIAYGVVQPFLPAAIIVGSHAPIWRWINLWRAIGWTLVLAFLIYAPLRVLRQKEGRGFTSALTLIVWGVILIAAFRGGSDMWDNPRYRATYAGLQVALVAWVWMEQRRAADPWLRRALLGVASILVWFLPWYLQRYTAFTWPVADPFKTLGLGIFTACLLILWDWARAENINRLKTRNKA